MRSVLKLLQLPKPSSSSSSPTISMTWKHHCWKDRHPIPTYHYSTDFDVVSANKAITYECQTGDLERARQLFDTMPQRTVVSWNTMITGYSKWDMFPQALDIVSLMHRSNVKLNETTFSTSLSVCGRAESLIDGEQVHGLVLRSGYMSIKFVGSALLYVYASCCKFEEGRRVFDELHVENELLWSLMLVAYVECGSMSEARGVFNRMPRRGVVDWTTLISGYVKSEDGCKEALELFQEMREIGESVPNEFTLDCVVRACGRLGDLWAGRVVHGLLVKYGIEYECSISSALIYFYSSSEAVDDAKKVYDYMLSPRMNDSNELVGGLLTFGRIREAELIFSNMAEKNNVSYNLMIKGYAMCGQFQDSENLFLQMPFRSLSSLNTMISVYARMGDIKKALELFGEAKGEGNPVTWNSMLSGYIQNNQHESALKLYLTMHRSSISQTRSTFSVLFHACACLGSLQQGELLHAQVVKSPFSSNVYVGTSLIDMYSKCGSIASARKVFSSINCPNVAAWTALINGHAHHSLGSDAVALFDLMLKSGIIPNAATFVAILSACAHAGLVEKGMEIFNLMREHYDITPTLEHFTCVVDLLGRSGLVHEAEEFIKEMPVEADKIVLISLLNASWSWMDMGVGERVAEKMIALDRSPSSACIIMSNMYSRSEKWGQKVKVRNFLKESGAKKVPGCSWIDANNRIPVF